MEKTLESSSWKDKVNLPTVGSLFLCLKQQSVGPLNTLLRRNCKEVTQKGEREELGYQLHHINSTLINSFRISYNR